MTVVVDRPPEVQAEAGPYVGLTFYTADDAAMFFGRESERKVLISNLRALRLTLLYAGSGVGKSSLLRAGVAARLGELGERSLRQFGTPRYIPVVFSSWRDDPTEELTEEIQKAVAPFVPPGSLDHLEPEGLAHLLDRVSFDADATILVILDQFEEYFLYRSRESREGRFADELAAALNQVDLRANFLIAIREDAYARLGDLFHGKIDNVYGNYLHLENLNRVSGREAIEKPIARFNELHPDAPPVEIEPALVDAVLLQLAPDQFGSDQTGRGTLSGPDGAGRARDAIAAPYLQLVMKRLWETELSSASRTLRLETLNELGGAQTIVNTHVDRALSHLSSVERDLALDLFHHLVTPSGTKIALDADDLADYTSHGGNEVEALLERLAGADTRIVRPVPPPPGSEGATRFEISHDLLAPAILDWRTRERAVRLEREKRVAEEVALAERRRARIFRALAIATGALLVVGIGLLVVALVLRANAVRDKQIAQSGHLAASADATLSQDPELATLLSLQALKIRDTPEAEAALRASLPQLQLTSTLSPPSPQRSATFSSNGSRIVTASADGAIRIWDAASRQPVATFPGFGALNGAALNRAGTRIVTANDDGTARIIDAHDGKLLGVLTAPGGYAVSTAAFSPNGQLIVTAGADGVARVWDARTGRQLPHKFPDPGGVLLDAMFSPDGTRIVTAGPSGTAKVWDVATGRQIVGLQAGPPLLSATFSADGKQVVTADAYGSARIWDLATGKQTGQLQSSANQYMMWSASFSPDDRQVLTAGGDGVVRIWNASTHELIRSLGHLGTDTIVAASFSPDGKSIVTASSGGIVAIWASSSPKRLATLPTGGGANRLESVAFSQDGTVAATGSQFGVVTIWKAFHARAGKVLWRPLNVINVPENDAVNGLALSPDGTRLATANQSGSAWIWSMPSGFLVSIATPGIEPLHSVQFDPQNPDWIVTADDDGYARIFDIAKDRSVGHRMGSSKWPMHDAVFSPDGTLIATASNDGYARVWDVSTQKQVGKAFFGSSGGLTSVAFNSDGTEVLATDGNGNAEVFDATNPQHPRRDRVQEPDGNRLNAGAFVRGSGLIITGGTDGMARIWDPANSTPLLSLAGHQGPITGLAVSDAGGKLITASTDGTAKIWDTQPIEQRALLAGGGDIFTVAYSPTNPNVLATVAGDGTVTLWNTQQPTTPLAQKPAPYGQYGGGSAEFSRDGRRLVVMGGAQQAEIWSLADLKHPARIGVLNLNQYLSCANQVNASTNAGLDSAEFSPNGTRVVTADADGTACIWNAKTDTPVRKLSEPIGASGGVSGTPPVGSTVLNWAVFSPDSSEVLTASADGTARIWDASDGELRRVLLEPSAESINEASFSPDGKLVATASDDGTTRIWDAGSGRQLEVLAEPNRSRVTSAAFSPDGRFLVTCSGSAHIWSVTTGQLLTTFQYGDNLSDCAFARDGSQVAAAGDGGQTRVFSTQLDGSIAELEAIAHQQVTRELTPAEKARYGAS
jgi:WD40 repeat protein